ncbi:hypothetical protein M9H77_30765 [Catharanthus roseus]|uniref:Uncharacterized protein n=1 Tax=Catharanthus roseus TaxID=4058 RepID=A0ACB9ZY51_CATRO|nr:hypothetical protein M9H77_30765 [Catharanthus roseus]
MPPDLSPYNAARLGLPDTGLISFGEMVDQGEQITQAVSMPIIGDGDNGYGNAMNVKRTVKAYIRAGFAGLILEDQVSPKACGHTCGRKVVSREEAVMKLKAAVDARKESGSDIVIVARTDSRQAVSLEESLWRSRSFADAGADVLFIDALESKEEMKAFCELCPHVPKMANMLEGGGKTPILNPTELEEIGYKLVAYPLSLMGVSIGAMQDALTAIRGGRMPSPGSMPSFEEIKEILGFNNYYEEEKRYATNITQFSAQRGSTWGVWYLDGSFTIPSHEAFSNIRLCDIFTSQPPLVSYISKELELEFMERQGSNFLILGNFSGSNNESNGQGGKEQEFQTVQDRGVEVFTPEVLDKYVADYSKGAFSGIWSRKLRVKITGGDGFEKLDIRIPLADFRFIFSANA